MGRVHIVVSHLRAPHLQLSNYSHVSTSSSTRKTLKFRNHNFPFHDFSSYDLFPPIIAVLLAAVIASRSYKHKSHDFSGALAFFLVMVIHIAAGWRYGAMLLAFFFTSSILTKKGAETKRSVDPEYKEGGQRNWGQVFANSFTATVLLVIVVKLTGWEDRCLDSRVSHSVTSLIGGIIGHYCCCNGNTWSSELGVLSNATPRLITTLKPVRKGTNGGVTKDGLLAAAAGGSVIGATFVLFGFLTAKCSTDVALKQLLVIPLSAIVGLCGSLIHSLLGATLQFSGFCSLRKKVVSIPGPTVKRISGLYMFDNNDVNFLSIFVTTVLTGIACTYIY